MKFATLIIVSILAFGAFITKAADAESSNFSQPPDTGRQGWFLSLLKTLADAGDLNDFDKVGSILGVKFDKTVTNTSPSHSEAFAKSFERFDYKPNALTWFRAGPIGYAYPGTLGWTIPSDGNSIYFKYYHLERYGLSTENRRIEFDHVKNDTESTIIFYGIPVLACITLKNITYYFPNIHYMARTDASSERYIYHPSINDETGSVLSFAATDNQCIPEASIQEFSRFGKRHARAQHKFKKCLQAAAKEFCQDHDQSNPGQHRWTEEEKKLFIQMNSYLREKCVNFNYFYENEPHSNEESPPPVYFGSFISPCHHYD